MNVGQDGEFSRELFLGRYNSDLANDLGNLVNRVLNMTTRFAAGAVPPAGTEGDAEDELRRLWEATGRLYVSLFEQFQFHTGLERLLAFVRSINGYVEKRAPWRLDKSGRARGPGAPGDFAGGDGGGAPACRGRASPRDARHSGAHRRRARATGPPAPGSTSSHGAGGWRAPRSPRRSSSSQAPAGGGQGPVTILPIDPVANASPEALSGFLCECRDGAARAGRPRLVSITIQVEDLDPLAVLESIFEPGERHFYAERPVRGLGRSPAPSRSSPSRPRARGASRPASASSTRPSATPSPWATRRSRSAGPISSPRSRSSTRWARASRSRRPGCLSRAGRSRAGTAARRPWQTSSSTAIRRSSRSPRGCGGRMPSSARSTSARPSSRTSGPGSAPGSARWGGAAGPTRRRSPTAVGRISRGELEKIVLARAKDVERGGAVPPADDAQRAPPAVPRLQRVLGGERAGPELHRRQPGAAPAGRGPRCAHGGAGRVRRQGRDGERGRRPRRRPPAQRQGPARAPDRARFDPAGAWAARPRA